MNRQDKGNGSKGIEWTNYTWNPIGGCQHGCRWHMPDGSTALCYAETQSSTVRRQSNGKFYGQGFEHHYWHPERLNEPLQQKQPARIFLDSMSDLMGAWVEEAQIQQVLDVCAKADRHEFQLLTKNAPRLLKFEFPPNVWVGASLPPSAMLGKTLTIQQQLAMLDKTLDVLGQIKAGVRWISFEPLSWDCAHLVRQHPGVLNWAVIGAASNGRQTFQPDWWHVYNLLGALDAQAVPCFFKGNLQWGAWREEFPTKAAKVPSFPCVDFVEHVEQMTMFPKAIEYN